MDTYELERSAVQAGEAAQGKRKGVEPTLEEQVFRALHSAPEMLSLRGARDALSLVEERVRRAGGEADAAHGALLYLCAAREHLGVLDKHIAYTARTARQVAIQGNQRVFAEAEREHELEVALNRYAALMQETVQERREARERISSLVHAQRVATRFWYALTAGYVTLLVIALVF